MIPSQEQASQPSDREEDGSHEPTPSRGAGGSLWHMEEGGTAFFKDVGQLHSIGWSTPSSLWAAQAVLGAIKRRHEVGRALVDLGGVRGEEGWILSRRVIHI